MKQLFLYAFLLISNAGICQFTIRTANEPGRIEVKKNFFSTRYSIGKSYVTDGKMIYETPVYISENQVYLHLLSRSEIDGKLFGWAKKSDAASAVWTVIAAVGVTVGCFAHNDTFKLVGWSAAIGGGIGALISIDHSNNRRHTAIMRYNVKMGYK